MRTSSIYLVVSWFCAAVGALLFFLEGEKFSEFMAVWTIATALWSIRYTILEGQPTRKE